MEGSAFAFRVRGMVSKTTLVSVSLVASLFVAAPVAASGAVIVEVGPPDGSLGFACTQYHDFVTWAVCFTIQSCYGTLPRGIRDWVCRPQPCKSMPEFCDESAAA